MAIKKILNHFYSDLKNFSQKYKTYKIKKANRKIWRDKFFWNMLLWWVVSVLLGVCVFISIYAYEKFWGMIWLLIFLFMLVRRFILIKMRCRDIFSCCTRRAIFCFLPPFSIILFFIPSKDWKIDWKSFVQKVSENKKFIIIVMLLLWIIIGLLLVRTSINKQSNFENELKCREYIEDVENFVFNRTKNLLEYKYWEELSDDKIEERASPYGIFYSKKHNNCMMYYDYDGMLRILPYEAASSDVAWYYGWYCPWPSDIDDCYYFYNKSYDELVENDLFKEHRNDDHTKLLYYDLNLDSKIWKGKKLNWITTFDDFWYTLGKLWVHQTKSWDGFVAHHGPFFAWIDEILYDIEYYRLYCDLVNVAWFILWMIVVYFVSHGIYLLICKTWIINNNKANEKAIKKK